MKKFESFPWYQMTTLKELFKDIFTEESLKEIEEEYQMAREEGIKLKEMDYEKFYEKWNDLENYKIRIDDGDMPEGIWAKHLGDDLFGINNHPLTDFVQFQDIVLGKTIVRPEQVIHRRWNTEVFFRLADENKKERERIWKASVEKELMLSFWTQTIGCILMKEKLSSEEAKCIATDFFKSINTEVSFEFEEQDEDDIR